MLSRRLDAAGDLRVGNLLPVRFTDPLVLAAAAVGSVDLVSLSGVLSPRRGEAARGFRPDRQAGWRIRQRDPS
ncbi:hypothetical protein GCM10020000_81280 [Streptomyces olivoverticillatus]